MWCILVIRSSFYTRTQAKVILYSSIPIVLIYENVITDKIKKSFTSDQRFITILTLLAIVSFTTLSYADYAFAQTDTGDKSIEQATITMNVVLKDGACDQLEKLNATSLTKCDNKKAELQFFVITFPPENFRDMGYTHPIKPIPGTYTDIMDDQLWLAYTDHLVQQNKLAQRGDSPTQGPIIKNVQVYLNENECKLVDDLGIKESDFSCKNGIVLDVSASTLQKLTDLDFVKRLKIYNDPDLFPNTLPENIEPIISEQSPIAPTITTEPSTNGYTPYILILIIMPVSVAITLFWRLRKKAKIEA